MFDALPLPPAYLSHVPWKMPSENTTPSLWLRVLSVISHTGLEEWWEMKLYIIVTQISCFFFFSQSTISRPPLLPSLSWVEGVTNMREKQLSFQSISVIGGELMGGIISLLFKGPRRRKLVKIKLWECLFLYLVLSVSERIRNLPRNQREREASRGPLRGAEALVIWLRRPTFPVPQPSPDTA